MREDMNKTDQQSDLFIESRDSILHVADQLAGATKSLMLTAKTEEDLRIGFEKLLDPLCSKLNIKLSPRYEKSIYTGGRSDAIHGRIIIEYERPGAFESKKWIEHAFDQLVEYIKGEAEDSKDTLFLFDPKYVGVGFDGRQIFYVKYKGDKNRAKAVLDNNDFILLGPFPFEHQSARTLLTYLRALSRKLLTAETLSEAFGPTSKIAPLVVSALTDALGNWGNARVQVFFNEWKRLFGIVYGEQFNTHQAEEADALSRLYGVDKEIDFQALLFSVHTYFALLMKFIAAEIITLRDSSLTSSLSNLLIHSSKEKLKISLTDIEDGWIYSRRGITNFLEGDFFCWYLDAFSPRLEEAIREAIRGLSEFEPATTFIDPASTRDLLKKLYQYLVPQEVRHKLGEYYTPDWLAELTLDETGYDGNTLKRFLDPACGSGTFIMLAIQRAKEYGKAHGEQELETAKRIVANIWGFDLNPLAVIAARTNYLFALGNMVEDIGFFEIPIYLADAVLWPEQSGQHQPLLAPRGESISIPTSVRTFFVPRIWVQDTGFLMKSAAPLVEKMVKAGYTITEAMECFEKEGLVFPPHEELVSGFYNDLLELEKQGKNGIWARFLKNVFAPMIAGKFDYVIGNPPWIRWGYLSQEYRHATLPLWQNYGLFSLKGHAARLGGGEKDFSMLFTYAAMDYYLKSKSKLGFLITQEVFKSKGAGEGFRRFRLGNKEHFKVLKAHDLVTVQPFEGAANKTAMIVARKDDETVYPVPYTVWFRKKGVGRIPTDAVLSEVIPLLQKRSLLANPIGTLTGSWQTISENQKDLKSLEGTNSYKAHQGADPQPYGVFLLSVKEVLSNSDLIICNLFEAGKRKVQQLEARVESNLVFPAVRGSDIERWGIRSEIYLLMTQDPDKREPFPESLMKRQYPLSFSYLLNFKSVLLSRASKSIRELAERTAFYAMFGIGTYTLAKYKVIWKLMSNDMVAAVISQQKTVFGFKALIPTKTVAFIGTENEDEAHYLCAIINSEPVREFIKSFSSAGRGFGTPSVISHLGIKKFDPNDKVHLTLSGFSQILHNLKLEDNADEITKYEKKINETIHQMFDMRKA